jgi:hypothetical protein
VIVLTLQAVAFAAALGCCDLIETCRLRICLLDTIDNSLSQNLDLISGRCTNDPVHFCIIGDDLRLSIIGNSHRIDLLLAVQFLPSMIPCTR